MLFQRFFSLDSAKAIKAREYGYLNAINYMARQPWLASATFAPMLRLAA